MDVERLAGGACGRPFPVYEDLVRNLLAAHGSEDAGRDAVVAHVLGTCSGYAYADIETVAMMMSRLGLEGSACVRIAQIVDAMHIFSTAYLVQSRCGRAAILCYRGTEPANLGNWLTDADVGSASIALGGDALVVHAGMLRNVRSTLWAVLDELNLALQGRSLRDPRQSVERPLEALYVTGHSLGGAMAVLFALSLAGTPEDREIADKLRADLHLRPAAGHRRAAARSGARSGTEAVPSRQRPRSHSGSAPCGLGTPGAFRTGVSVTRTVSGGIGHARHSARRVSEKFHARSWPSSAPRSAGTPPATRWTSTARTTTFPHSGRRAAPTEFGDQV